MTSVYWSIVASPRASNMNANKENRQASNGTQDLSASRNEMKREDGDAGSYMEGSGTSHHQDRGSWASKAEFLLSCIGFAVGLGNVWRFPYKCYINGGGAFLIPYLLCLAGIGLPLMVMELSFGQFASQGTIGAWKISPLFKGMGTIMLTVVTVVGIYYNVVISYIMYYLFASFHTGTLPWSTCGNWWNSEQCVESARATALNGTNITTSGPADDAMIFSTSNRSIVNTSISNRAFSNATNVTQKTSAEEYWERYILQLSSGLSDVGEVRWELALLLLLSWIIIFLCLIKGVKSSGKVVYFTAVFPYVVLFILLVRGATLPGASTGILYYITPRPEKLLDATVWFDAALQIFYSLCPGSGALIMLGSFNKFNNNCIRDGIVVSLMNCATSILCGFVVFSVIGFLSHELGQSPDQVVTGGPGLAFVTFSTALSKMPGAAVWAVLFFLMLFTVGLDSQFVAIEVIISGLTDVFPLLQKHKSLFALIVCITLFFLGLPMVTNGGMYLLHLVDSYIAGIPLLLLAFLECIIIQWIYGQQRFVEDIRFMVGSAPNMYLRLCWKYISPLLIIALVIFCLVMFRPLTYGEYMYPAWSNGLGWCTTTLLFLVLPLGALYEVRGKVKTDGWKKALKNSLQPHKKWGPLDPVHRKQWLMQAGNRHPHIMQNNTVADKQVDITRIQLMSGADLTLQNHRQEAKCEEKSATEDCCMMTIAEEDESDM